MEQNELKNLIRGHLTPDEKLISYPTKRKKKNLVLLWLSGRFEKGIVYTEKQVNELINQACCFSDPALLRRELYNYRFLDRKNDGSAYWLMDPQPTLEQLGL